MTKFVFVLCAFALLSMLTVWQHLQSVQAGYEINRLRKVRSVLFEENRRLKLEADRLKSPELLLRKVKELGLELRPARPEEVVRIDNSP